MPTVNPNDSVIAAIKDLSKTLQTFASVVLQTRSQIDDPVLLELRTLASIYESTISAPLADPLQHTTLAAPTVPRVNAESQSTLHINDTLCTISEGVIN